MERKLDIFWRITDYVEGDAQMYKAIIEGLTLTQNSIATARNGAEKFVDLAKEFANRAAFFATEHSKHMQVVNEMQKIAERMQTVIDQSTFNGDNLLKSSSGTWTGEKWVNTDERSVVSGVTRVNVHSNNHSVSARNANATNQNPDMAGSCPSAHWTPHESNC